MDPALIGNRADVTALVLEAEMEDLNRHQILRGWRADFLGNQLLDVLRGKDSVRINSETKLPELMES